jgi:large subunit ribosomal protein L21
MYAVIRAGGKQHKVAEGDIIEVERIKGSGTVEFTPLLIVDDKGKVQAGRGELGKAVVTAKILGEVRGAKVDVYKFRNKTGYRRHTGHRQSYSQIEISGIKLSGGTATEKKSTAKKTTAKSTAKKTTAKSSAKKTTAKSTAKKSTAKTTAKKTTKKKTTTKKDEGEEE